MTPKGRTGLPPPAGRDPAAPSPTPAVGRGLTQSQASALASIGQLGSPTLGALASRESVQPPSMTRIVAGLEEMGHVTRVVDPADRRVARVTLTAAGRRVLERSRSLKNAFLAERLRPPGPRRAPRARPADRAARAAPGRGRVMTAVRAAVHQTFSSLRIRNYRLYFTAQLISVSGTWMQTVAQAWLVLHLHRERRGPGHRGGPAVPAHAAVRALRRPGGRPDEQADPALRHPDRPAGCWRWSSASWSVTRRRRSCGRSTCWRRCSGWSTSSTTRPARPSSWRWSAGTTCPTRSASTPWS